MTAEQAAQIVETQRAKLRIDPSMRMESVEQTIVRFKKDRAVPGPYELRVAWLVVLGNPFGDVQVQVDDATGQILHTRRSA